MSRQYNLKRVGENNQLLVAQHLDLSPNMKMAMAAAELARLARPENHVYTYHWETQNCSTLIRDLINDSTNGSLEALPELNSMPTRRFEVLRHLGNLGWAWFGWDTWHPIMGMGPMIDGPQLHIPQALHDGVGQATIQWEGDENQKPLVDRTCVLNEGKWAPAEPLDRTSILWGMGTLMDCWIWLTRIRSRIWQVPTMVWFTLSGLLSAFSSVAG